MQAQPLKTNLFYQHCVLNITQTDYFFKNTIILINIFLLTLCEQTTPALYYNVNSKEDGRCLGCCDKERIVCTS